AANAEVGAKLKEEQERHQETKKALEDCLAKLDGAAREAFERKKASGEADIRVALDAANAQLLEMQVHADMAQAGDEECRDALEAAEKRAAEKRAAEKRVEKERARSRSLQKALSEAEAALDLAMVLEDSAGGGQGKPSANGEEEGEMAEGEIERLHGQAARMTEQLEKSHAKNRKLIYKVVRGYA
ncbi:hypothetical protein T484DRAFT_1793871, partial [Baffinella frigidus]